MKRILVILMLYIDLALGQGVILHPISMRQLRGLEGGNLWTRSGKRSVHKLEKKTAGFCIFRYQEMV